MAADKFAGSTLNLCDLILVFNSRKAVAQIGHNEVRNIFLGEEPTLIHTFAQKKERGTPHQRIVDIKEGHSPLIERHITSLANLAEKVPLRLVYDYAMATTVHLLRHGEVHNPEKILYGRQPGWRLSDRGQEMARVVADWSKQFDVGAVIASPLQRAQETAAPLAQTHGLEILTDADLIEAANIFEGQKFELGSGVFRHPKSWRYLTKPWVPSWGEPYDVLIERMLRAVFSARDIANGKDVFCVSHQLPIWILRSAVEGKRLMHDPRRRECTLASVTSFHIDSSGAIEGVSYLEPAKHLLPVKK